MGEKDLVVMLLVLVIGLASWLAVHRDKPARYRSKPILTGGEREFFYRLRRALPDCIVCPQLALGTLIEPQGMGPERQAALARIADERVAYAVFDQALRLLTVIELGRHSKPSRREAARTACFASAGIRTVRFRLRHLPSEAAIHAEVFAREEICQAAQPARDAPAGIDFHGAGRWRDTASLNY